MTQETSTVIVETTCGTPFIIDKEDYDSVSKFNWHTSNEGYVLRTVYIEEGKWDKVRLHRFLINPPTGMVVDHINRDILDNRKSNLRVATRMENSWNSGLKSTNKSGYKGVSYREASRKWRAQLYVDGKKMCLGHFTNKHDAARMFNFWAKDLQGEFAWLNKIKEGVDV